MSQRFSLSRPREKATKHSNYVGLVIEGGALAVGLQKEHQDKFIELCSSCRSVVCCRWVGGGGWDVGGCITPGSQGKVGKVGR